MVPALRTNATDLTKEFLDRFGIAPIFGETIPFVDVHSGEQVGDFDGDGGAAGSKHLRKGFGAGEIHSETVGG